MIVDPGQRGRVDVPAMPLSRSRRPALPRVEAEVERQAERLGEPFQ
jgi:hypothetical protein